ncbi:reticulon-4 receptor-like 1 isoform X2 [Zophobas morio]|uniref:reticulon-4 receptor-like 1 isoform X2 n=1 Tax=Zophobas morio TaxID=2755281 RepID=UPI00308272BC
MSFFLSLKFLLAILRGVSSQVGCPTPPFKSPYLYLSECPYVVSVLTKDHLSSNLLILDLSKNGLTSLAENFFNNSKNLENLVLNQNQFTFLGKRIFTVLHKLTTLALSSNSLSEIEDGLLDGLRDLQFLDLAYNRLTSLNFDVFKDLAQLTGLFLQGNYIKSLSYSSRLNLTNLLYLGLHSNRFSSLDEFYFRHLAALKTLYLFNNSIEMIAPGAFNELQELTLL